jgi:hypothetical protein
VKKAVGKVVSSTIVDGSQQVDVGWIQGGTLIAPQQFAKEVFFYKYPAGGKATKVISGLSAPFGATVSLAK